MQPLTDIFIPLGNGSKYGDLELRYALRSIEKFAKNFNRIFVVGNYPGFKLSPKVNHIHFADNMSEPKQSRIATKTSFFFRETGSEKAAQWNDDYVLLKTTDINNLRAYTDGSLQAKIDRCRTQKPSLYTVALELTMRELLLRGIKNPTHFDIHTPTTFTKIGWEKLQDTWNKSRCCPTGFVIRTCYHNLNQGEFPVEPLEDLKIKDTSDSELNKAVTRWVLSYNDNAIGTSEKGLLKTLQKLFPKPSRYELS